ncbi:MAG: hypothetical protein A2148_06345 [Chloroflexi bacterium RBG_16_68_14]|nr:MAG: hypothetical protein A2148_06345 [Chloroflexi bacterium RBG_16_68_14]
MKLKRFADTDQRVDVYLVVVPFFSKALTGLPGLHESTEIRTLVLFFFQHLVRISHPSIHVYDNETSRSLSV